MCNISYVNAAWEMTAMIADEHKAPGKLHGKLFDWDVGSFVTELSEAYATSCHDDVLVSSNETIITRVMLTSQQN